jgi:hypothetical protein
MAHSSARKKCQNKAATKKRRVAHKAQHKKCQISKRDRNDDRTKRRKAGELGVSSDEDPSPEPSWSGDVASAVVDGSNMLGSSLSSPPRGTEVSSSRRSQKAGRDKTLGPSSRQGAPPARVDQRPVRSRAMPSRTGTSEPQRLAPRQADPPRRSEERSTSARPLYDGSDRPDHNSLQRRGSRGRSSDSASTQSAPPVAEPSATPQRLQTLLIRGGGVPDVPLSLVTGGGHGPAPVAAEAGGTAPKRTGESVAAVEAVGRSRAALETAGPRRAVPKQGSKCATPEQGTPDCPVKKARVHSKM